MELEQNQPFCFVCYARFYNDGSLLLREKGTFKCLEIH